MCHEAGRPVNSQARTPALRPNDNCWELESLIGKAGSMGLNSTMPTLEQIENQVKHLTKAEQEALRNWRANVLEDQLDLTGEFKAEIERRER